MEKPNQTNATIARKMLRKAVKDYYEEHGKQSSSYYERSAYRFSFTYKDDYGSLFSVKGPKDYRFDQRCLSTATYHIYFTKLDDPIIMFKDLALFHGYARQNEENDLTKSAKSFSNWLKAKTNDQQWLENLKTQVERSMLTKNVQQSGVLKPTKTISAL